MKEIILALLFIMLSITASAETVTFKSGKVIEGKIVNRTDEYIEVDEGIGMTLTYYLDEIEIISEKKDNPEIDFIENDLKDKPYDEGVQNVPESNDNANHSSEIVYLKDGKILEGKIISNTDTKIKFETKHGTLDIYLKMVDRIDAPSSVYLNLSRIQDNLEQARQKDAQEKKLADAIEKSKVKFFMTTWCPWCTKAENFMKENEILYIKYDFENDFEAREKYETYPSPRGIPMLVIGEKRINGYDPDWIIENYKASEAIMNE